MEKKRLIILSLALISLLAISLASAEFWACFDKGEKAYYCENYKPQKICTSDTGCQWCMLSYNEADDCYIHGAWPKCNKLLPQCSGLGNGSGNIDGEAPQFILTSPSEGQLFNSRKALVEFSLNEPADVYYIDAVNGRGKWSKLCSNCDAGNPTYSKLVSFDDGENIIQFKAIDEAGNVAFSNNVSFFIDSKKPKIKKTLPKKGFANGEFEVEFQEGNPKALTLRYGINGSSSQAIAISSCNKSGTSNDKYYCVVNVNLGAYNGQEISYWFTLEDLVGNVINSKPINLKVDMSAPQVLNPSSFFSYENGTKYVYFNLSINEENFNEATYSYLDSKGRMKEGTLCTRLKDGTCYKKLTFTKEGAYDLTISIIDEAGNSIGLPANFVVDF